jgi:hypothetical protein
MDRNVIEFGNGLTFRRTISSLSVRSKSKPSKKPAEAGGNLSSALSSSPSLTLIFKPATDYGTYLLAKEHYFERK